MNAGPRLSVNLNKVALLRNSRRTGVPDLLHFAKLVHDAGAHGITIHPRPDERHIRHGDVLTLIDLMAPWRPVFELNMEGYPDDRFLDLVSRARPEQCTLVPDAPTAFTSEEGWKLDASEVRLVREAVQTVASLRARPIVFVDPNEKVVSRVPETGAVGVEIYTGSYAAAARLGPSVEALKACSQAAQRAETLGLIVNVGHDLNLSNLPALLAAMPQVVEASIGHELTADALVMGFAEAIAAYKKVLGDSVHAR